MNVIHTLCIRYTSILLYFYTISYIHTVHYMHIIGAYFDNSKPTSPSPAAQNTATADWLWTQSETLTGKPFVV